MATNNKLYQRNYMMQYIKTPYGFYSTKISNIKRSAKFKNNIHPKRLNLTTEDFLCIITEFNNKCAYCGQHFNILVPSMIIRFSHGGNLCYNNVVCACSNCNKQKLSQTKIQSWEQWYFHQSFFSRERYNNIINHQSL